MSEHGPEQYEPVLGQIDTQLRAARQHGSDQQLLISPPAEGKTLPDFSQYDQELLDLFVAGEIDRDDPDVLLPEAAEIQDLYANDILSPDMEMKLDQAKDDATKIARITRQEAHTDEDIEPAAHAAYRGIVFANMVLEEIKADSQPVPLGKYWESIAGLTPELADRKTTTDALDYYFSNEEVQSLLDYYKPELTRLEDTEEMVIIGACLTFRRAEVNAAVSNVMPPFQQKLSQLPEDASGHS